MMVQVHIHRTIIPYQLYFAGHSVDTGRDCHAACHGDEENVTAMGISTRAFQTPSGEMGAPPKLQSLSTRIFWATHATSFIGSALYASASSFEYGFLEKSFIGGQHLVAYAWIAHISAEMVGILAHTGLHVVHQNFQCNVAEVFCRNPLEQVQTSSFGLFRAQPCHEVGNDPMVSSGSDQYP